jgi:general secretion pathway protein J
MKQRGFTLLEMIIGITLLGFILVLLYGGLRLSIRSWDSGNQRVESTTRQTIVSDFLRRLLTQTYPLQWKQDDGKKTLAFAGEADNLSFAGPIPARLGTGGIYLLELKGVKDIEDSELHLQWRLPDPKVNKFDFPGGPDDTDQAHLAKGLEKIEFAYFGAENKDDDPAWHDEWHSDTLLPQLIRLRLTGKAGEVWPEIVVTPKVSGAECRWDPVYKRCM